MYFFYATALVPFTAVLLGLALGNLAQRGARVRVPWLRKITGVPMRSGQLAVLAYLVIVAASFCYWGPILYGIRIPESYFQSIMWLPSWS